MNLTNASISLTLSLSVALSVALSMSLPLTDYIPVAHPLPLSLLQGSGDLFKGYKLVFYVFTKEMIIILDSVP
jgi:hypothetical protein